MRAGRRRGRRGRRRLLRRHQGRWNGSSAGGECGLLEEIPAQEALIHAHQCKAGRLPWYTTNPEVQDTRLRARNKLTG